MSKELLEELKVSILEEDRSLNRKRWAKRLVDEHIKLEDWLETLSDEKRLATRFLWVLGDVAELNPALVFPLIPYLFEHRDRLKIPGVYRSIAKWVWLAGVPEELEGILLDEFLLWIGTQKTEVAVRCYAVESLIHFAKKYPELIPELKLHVGEQMQHASNSLKVRCKKLLKAFEKLDSGQ